MSGFDEYGDDADFDEPDDHPDWCCCEYCDEQTLRVRFRDGARWYGDIRIPDDVRKWETRTYVCGLMLQRPQFRYMFLEGPERDDMEEKIRYL